MNNTVELDFFQPGLETKVKDMCKNNKANDELEVSFGSMKKPISLKKFHNLLKYIKFRSIRDKLQKKISTTLDISYRYDQSSASTFRLTISDIQNINRFIQNNSLHRNHTIFSKQIRMYLNQDDKSKTEDKIGLINKIRTSDKFIALDEYDMRIKMSEENADIEQSVLNKLLSLDESERHQISFRYKQRVSLIVENNSDYIVSIDLTDVKGSNNINHLIDSLSQYELEIDISFKKSLSGSKLNDVCSELAKSMFKLEQFLQESYLLVTKTETIEVIKNLNKLSYEDENDTYKDLPAMQSASVEVQHILDHIPGHYTVTDKADGERYFLMTYQYTQPIDKTNKSADKPKAYFNTYLISGNLDVKKIKSTVVSENKAINPYNLTIIDGEYMYIAKYGKFLFLAFDILFFQGKDVRNEESLKNRLLLTAKALKDLYSVDMTIGIFGKDKDTANAGDYEIDKIVEFNRTNIVNHLTQLNKSLKESPDNQVISCKYFIFPLTVGNQNDIYTLSTLLYETYTLNAELACPYILDGLIYTPLNQKYTRNQREIKYKILKWKPEKNNSIDFYVQFERNPDTKKIITLYDRTNDSALETYIDNRKKLATETDIDFTEVDNLKVQNSLYQILNLYVGKMKNNLETPVPFQKENDLNQAYIYLSDEYPRDIEGNILSDSTVVEFSYDDSIDVQQFRWVPLRTRYDKTESVMRYKRKYGNNSEIANRVWNSIQNPIKFEDIKILGDPSRSANHIKLLKSKISNETISLVRRDDTYYQLVTNLGESLRNFHNWIKSNMIYTYCSKKTLLDSSKVGMDVLDIGIGRGGDLMKLYHAKVKSAIGIDVNEAGIFSGSDGAISRYNVMKKKMPGFPRMQFMVVDARQKFDYENQSSLGKMNDQNVKLLKQVFGDNQNSNKHYTFDVINAQFMLHYLLQNVDTWNNFCSNINKYLRSDGYLLITTLDGEMVDKSFKNDHITRDYITSDGQKRTLFDIVKKYPADTNLSKLKTTESNLGLAIDVHIPIFMEEGVYQTEYLVNPSFLIRELKSKCNMRLVETESFQNIYYVYKDFFENTAEYESKSETRKFFANVKKFYDLKDETSRNWFEYSRHNRFYIFQKL
jgi:SAM-dependent methyltransferase